MGSHAELDLSDVVSSGYYDIADRVAEDARVEPTSDYPLNTKVIVLTKFNQKLAAAVTDSAVIQSQDWTGIRAILDMVRQAFENEVG